KLVTGVQTCALPISARAPHLTHRGSVTRTTLGKLFHTQRASLVSEARSDAGLQRGGRLAHLLPTPGRQHERWESGGAIDASAREIGRASCRERGEIG